MKWRLWVWAAVLAWAAAGCTTTRKVTLDTAAAQKLVPPAFRKAGWTAVVARAPLAGPGGYALKDVVYLENTVGMKLVVVPAGEFAMGDALKPEDLAAKWQGAKPEWFRDAQPQRKVRISRAFAMGAFEVSRGQFRLFVDETGYKTDAEKHGQAWILKDRRWGPGLGASWRSPGFDQEDDHPVVGVSWNDAKAFCAWLSKREGLNYRLPTEAEWEYAARGGEEGGLWFWGNVEVAAQGKINAAGQDEGVVWDWVFDGLKDGYTYTAPCGTYAPNGYGLFDMIGNVCEWVEDRYDAKAYAGGDAVDPKGPEKGATRCLRGGGWCGYPAVTRSAFRDANSPETANVANGFRVVCEGVE